MSLKIIPGKVIALVGESGGGKSTVSNLIQRFYDPDSGEILVDNVPLKELDTVWYRKHIASVSQEPVLFATTIRENILYGNLDATEEEIIQAAKEANAHDFIVNYAEGYNTLVGK
jgi:ABC-type multidrug transport system fused ATPase/permease subunit